MQVNGCIKQWAHHRMGYRFRIQTRFVTSKNVTFNESSQDFYIFSFIENKNSIDWIRCNSSVSHLWNELTDWYVSDNAINRASTLQCQCLLCTHWIRLEKFDMSGNFQYINWKWLLDCVPKCLQHLSHIHRMFRVEQQSIIRFVDIVAKNSSNSGQVCSPSFVTILYLLRWMFSKNC